MFMKSIKNLFIIIFIALFAYIPFVKADSFDDFYAELDGFFNENSENTTIINNNVKASSNTGGNIAESGTVIRGASETSLKVKTIINGETVEDIDINKISEDGDQNIIYNSKIEVNEDKVNIESSKDINGEIDNIKKEIILDKNNKKEIDNIVNPNQYLSTPTPETILDTEGDNEISVETKNKETTLIEKIINMILDIFKNNVNRIAKLF